MSGIHSMTARRRSVRLAYDLGRAIAEADEVFRLAIEKGDAKVALAAVELKAKLTGLPAARPRDAQGSELEELSDDALDARIRRLAAENGFELVARGTIAPDAGAAAGELSALPETA